MASPESEASFLRKIEKNPKPLLPDVPTDSPYRKLWDLLATAGETASAHLIANRVRKIWQRKVPRNSPRVLPVQVYGFPNLKETSKRIVLFEGVGENRIKQIQKIRPDIPDYILEYFQYFGEMIPLHLVHKRALLFGFEGGAWSPENLNSKTIQEYIEEEYWAADEEVFPGIPIVLFGHDHHKNLWFLSDESREVWAFDDSIQGIRNANYYDGDDLTLIDWPQYVLRILKSWSQ